MREKYTFNGRSYELAKVRKLAAEAFGLKEELVDTTEKVDELVHMIVRGNPTRFAKFMTSLNEGISK